MGKVNKVVVFGKTRTGKTAMINKIIYPESNMVGVDLCPTIEDIYMGLIESDRVTGPKGPEKERVCFYDTAGLESPLSEVPKHYITMADGFLLVYSIDSIESFQCVEKLKRDIDKFKEKKEVTIVAIGNKSDLESKRQVTKTHAEAWAAKEKVLLREATVTDRKTLSEPLVQMVSKMTAPPMEEHHHHHSLRHPSSLFHVPMSTHGTRSKSPASKTMGALKGAWGATSLRKASHALGISAKSKEPKEAKTRSHSTIVKPKK